MLKDRSVILSLVIIIVAYLLYMIKGIIFPFILSLIFAYLLDPMVTRLQKYKISRTLGTIIVTLGFFTILVLIFTMIVPLMYNQISKLIEFLMHYKDSLNKHHMPAVVNKIKGLPPEYLDKFKQSLNSISGNLVNFATTLLKEIFYSGAVAVNTISLIFITPIVTFYLLKDWKNIPKTIKNLIPIKFKGESIQLFKELNQTLSGYLRGQILVCLILGCYYATSLSILGLESGLSLGILTGMFSFIPFVGILFGLALAILIAALQFQSLTYIIAVLGIFAIGQIMEGSFITPKLIGDKVGLNPVWIIFGLLALGALFGFIGVLIAVPLTAVLGVVIRFALTKYKQSELYKN